MSYRFAAALGAVVVAALAVFAGTSLAGNGNGGGHGNANKQSSTSASSPATGGSNTQGVKPSNSTKHDTYATASSDQTKKYGNGKTAGEIATQYGQGDATLYGPGNSQPHKTSCGGHEVDVHALKHHGDSCGTTTTTTSSKSAAVSPSHTTFFAARAPAPSAASSGGDSTPTVTPAAAPAAVPVVTGVKGATHTITPKAATAPVAKPKPVTGVLGATAHLGHAVSSSGTLPFTGLTLTFFALAALGFILVGLSVRRTLRARI